MVRTADTTLYRIGFHRPDAPTRATRSPWSPNAPDTAAADLAARLGMDTPIFKRRVRQLKELGPTLSQPVGHRLSPRGTAYLTGRPGR